MRFWNAVGGSSITGTFFLVALVALVAAAAPACVGDDPSAGAPAPCTGAGCAEGGAPGSEGGPGAEAGPSSSLLLGLDKKDVTLRQGASASVAITVQRVGGAASAVHFDTNAPAGLLVPSLTIAPDAAKGTLEIDAKADAHATGGTPLVITVSARADTGETATATINVTVVGAPGALDTTFATNGVTTTSFGNTYEQPKCMLIDAADRIIVGGMSATASTAGTPVVARFTADGVLDVTFAPPNGYVMGPAGVVANACALAPDGSIVVAGSTGASYTAAQDFAAFHVLASGALDTTFGSAGVATKDFASGADTSSGVVVLADGTIVLTGATADLGVNPAHERVAAVRFTAAGVAGTSVAPTQLNNLDGAAGAALAQSGDVLVVGTSGASGMIQDPTAAMVQSLNPTTLARDAAFSGGTGYYVDGRFGTNQFYGGAIAVAPDGKLVVVGGGYSNGGALLGGFRVIRFTKDGVPDSTFAGGGGTSFAVGTSYSGAYGAAVAADGKIIVAGIAQNTQAEGNDFTLLRLGVDGTLDATFDADGKVFVPIAPGSGDNAVAVRLQKDGRIVVAGSTSKMSTVHWALARVWP